MGKKRRMVSVSENACLYGILKFELIPEKWNSCPHALSAFINGDSLKTDKPYNERVRE
jgi:hypothetical protein